MNYFVIYSLQILQVLWVGKESLRTFNMVPDNLYKSLETHKYKMESFVPDRTLIYQYSCQLHADR